MSSGRSRKGWGGLRHVWSTGMVAARQAGGRSPCSPPLIYDSWPFFPSSSFRTVLLARLLLLSSQRTSDPYDAYGFRISSIASIESRSHFRRPLPLKHFLHTLFLCMTTPPPLRVERRFPIIVSTVCFHRQHDRLQLSHGGHYEAPC